MRRWFSKKANTPTPDLDTPPLSASVWKKTAALVAVALVLTILAIAGSRYWLLNREGPLETSATVVIVPGASVSKMGHQLAAHQVIESPQYFRVAVALMGIQNSLKAGEYLFKPHASLKDVIAQLSAGNVVTHTVTIPEGLTVDKIFERLQTLPLKVSERDLAEMPEGSLYPDTYAYHYGDSLGQLVARMQKRMEKELQAAWDVHVSSLPLHSPNELLILASIVEKETAKAEERAQIAGVFINRLRRGMKLQSDPTVIYGARDYAGDLKARHLKEDTPYNTYVHKGLPPTPISNPGREALMAVAVPESHDYLYFVADGVTGGHVFSRTYEEHLQNVERYLRAYRQKHKK